MTLKHTVLVLIGDTLISLAEAEHVCSTYNTRYGGDVYFCDAEQECCDAGCCYETNYAKYLWLLLFSIFTLAACWYFCAKYCCQQTNIDHHDTFRNPRPIASPEFELPTGRSRDGHLHTLVITTVPNHHNQSVENTHPITPPPPYEAVMAAPLQAENRVPSYEDVMAANNKK